MGGRADGPSRSILGLARGQADLGEEIGLLISEPTNIKVSDIPENIKLLAGPSKRHRNPFFLSSKWIEKIKREFGTPDLVHFHDFYIPFQFALARLVKKEGWPYISSPRGSLRILAQQKKGFKKRLANFLFAKKFLDEATFVHALSNEEAKEMKKFVNEERITISPNGVSAELISLSKRIEKSDLGGFSQPEDLVLIYIGRIDVFTKGHDLLLGAIKRLQERGQGEDVKLIMVGPYYTEQDKQKINSLMADLPYPDNVKFTGPLYSDEKWQMLAASDVFILTSRHEGMPNAALEAMALGKPCLATPGTSLREILDESGGGWLAEESSESIAQKIMDIKRNRENISLRGRAALEYIKNKMIWDKVATGMLEKIKAAMYNKPSNKIG